MQSKHYAVETLKKENMIDYKDLFTKPSAKPTETDLKEWFHRIAHCLLCDTRLMVKGKPHRLVEIEIYYHHPEFHPDIFAHCDPIQLHCGRWYFHRTKGEYRGGSFKGLDISFGEDDAHAGVLIRGVESPEGGALIDGPSLHVDHLLTMTGHSSVANLDSAIDERLAWEEDSPLQLLAIDEVEERQVYTTARVGLSLKRAQQSALPPKFVLQPYRFLTEPKRTKKGRLHLILSLYTQGESVESIKTITGSTTTTIQRYIDDFKIGQQKVDFTDYFGKELTSKDLCQLHGTWNTQYGQSAT